MRSGTTENFETSIVRGFGPDRSALELNLQQRGVLLPITDRAELIRAFGYADAAILTISDPTGRPLRAANIAISSTRSLPGHFRFRVSHLGATEQAAVDQHLLESIADYARGDARCLSLVIELFEPDAERRARMASTLAALGFTRQARARNYQTTIALDLAPGIDELLRNLHGTTRRDIRAPHRRNMEVRQVSDVSFAAHIESLVARTFERTGSEAPALPWKEIIEESMRAPSLSRVTGVFDPRFTGPAALVSFAWGINHGSHTTYEAGASVRSKEVGNFPLGYAPMWDLITWAKENNSAWFDFGGITAGSRESGDPVGGISSFKRKFCSNVVKVGEEWALHPNPVRSSIANFITSVARGVLPRSRGTS